MQISGQCEKKLNKKLDLNDRSLHLLKTLVERYIHDGQPVGSRALSKNAGIKLSPATIRNVMSDLEDLGLVHSPHTSAGRVPTVSGYRFFVDSLLTVKPLQTSEICQLDEQFTGAENATDIVSRASTILSDVTQMAGVVTLPRREVVNFRHMEFLSLSHNRILVIFVTNEDEVHNKVIHTSKNFNEAELLQAANYLNAVYSGQSLSVVREAVLNDLQSDQQQLNQGMIDAVNIARMAFEQPQKDDYVLSGETNLMSFNELSGTKHLKQLFDAFSQKQGVIHLLDQCLLAEGIQIYIGEESGYQAFEQCSLVTSTYAINDETVGVLGVIGPTRMAYEKVIPFVDVTAKLLGSALNPK